MQDTPHISTRHTDVIVSVQKAKQWLRLPQDYCEEDDTIADAIESAVRRVEEECNLSLGISTYRWNTSGMPCDFRDAKYVKEIVSVTIDGELLEADTHYKLVRTGPVYSRIDWFGVTPARETTIVFRAGFGPGEVPPNLILAIRAMVQQHFDAEGDSVSEKKTLSDKLIAPFQHGYAG